MTPHPYWLASRPQRIARRRRPLRAGALVALLHVFVACSPDTALENSFGVDRPANVRVEHFDELLLNRDGGQIWVLSPVNDAFLQRLVTESRLTRHEPGHEHMPGLTSDWPVWWNTDSIEALPELYYRADESEHWRVWVDRRANRLYLQRFGT